MSLRGLGIMNTGEPEKSGESYYLKKLSKLIRLDTIVDVGAYIGDYSKLLRFYFPQANIYAIEPHPETFEKLKAVAQEYKLFICNQGFGNYVGKSNLWDFADGAFSQPSSPLASTNKDVIEKLHKRKTQAYEISINTLDNFAKENKIKKIDFLKIDTEGTEFTVLQGAKNLIKNNKISFIQIEVNEMNGYSPIKW